MTTSLCPTMQTVILQRDEIPVRRPHLGHDRPRFLSWLQVRAARHPMPSLLPLPTWWSVSSSRTPDDYFTMITASHSFTCCRHVTWRELPHSPRPSDFCGRPAPAKYGHRRLSAEDGAYYRGRRLLSQKYHYRINSFAANQWHWHSTGAAGWNLWNKAGKEGRYGAPSLAVLEPGMLYQVTGAFRLWSAYPL